MDSEQYGQLKELFSQAVELPEADRADFVERNCAGRPELRSELQSLLEHHVPQKTLLPMAQPAKSRGGTTTIGRWTARLLQPLSQSVFRGPAGTMIVAAATICLLAATGSGFWIYWSLRQQLLQREAVDLQSTCRAVEGVVTQVLDRDLWLAQACGHHPELGSAAQHLAQSVAASEAQMQPQSDPQLTNVVQQVLRAYWGRDVQFVIWNGDAGQSLASAGFEHDVDRLASDWNIGMVYRALQGESSIHWPNSQSRWPEPVLFDRPARGVEFLVPIRGDHQRIVGALKLWDTGCERRILQTLQTQRIGRGETTFLFGDDGQRLTHSVQLLRSEPPLATRSPEATADDLEWLVTSRAGNRRAMEDANASKQRAFLRQAQHSSPGVNLRAYTDAAGQRAAGAWNWLDRYHFGVAVELDHAEVMKPIGALNISFATTAGLFVLAIGILISIAVSLQRALVRRERNRLGPYILGELLGEGGMGQVFKAHHDLLKRPAAVKVLKSEVVSEVSLRRFTREARLASHLRHPNTVQIYDYGSTPDGRFYYAMECLVGVNLGDLVQRFGPLPPARAIFLLQQICASLREAHESGVVHRDIKPQNIMTCVCGGEADVVKVLDFGLVKQIAPEAVDGDTTSAGWAGTPRYMPPERILHLAGADPRSDVYACGAVAYWLLNGREVFSGSDPDAIFDDIVMVPAESLAGVATLPAPLRSLIVRTLAKDPGDRPQSMTEFLAALAAVPLEIPWTAAAAAAWWKEHLPEHWRGVPQSASSRRSFVARSQSDSPPDADAEPAGSILRIPAPSPAMRIST